MNIRKKIFMMLDKDNSIKNQIEEIKKANQDDKYAEKLKNNAINELIKYVNENVSFYKKNKIKEFKDFPIVNKNMMKNNISDFRTQKEIKIGKIRHTSGSTGIPFEIYQDERKAKRIQAEVIYYRELTGDELGNKFVNLMSPSRLEKMSCLSKIKQNVIVLDVTKMNNETMEKLYKTLIKNKKIQYMMGYASALKLIADYFYEHNYINKIKLKAVVTSSEIMTESTILKIKKVFNCKVYDRYSNEDNGFIAQTNGNTHNFYINRGSYYVEILKLNSNECADENEMGRIVVTDLYNYAQPFIRYDTGDLGSYSYIKENNSNKMVLNKLEGRISDIVYDTEDNPISTIAIGSALQVFDKIKQYQLIQKGKNNFILNIIDEDQKYKKEEYFKALKNVLGNEIEIKLNYLDNIPTYNSGKFRRVICEYKPSKV